LRERATKEKERVKETETDRERQREVNKQRESELKGAGPRQQARQTETKKGYAGVRTYKRVSKGARERKAEREGERAQESERESRHAPTREGGEEDVEVRERGGRGREGESARGGGRGREMNQKHAKNPAEFADRQAAYLLVIFLMLGEIWRKCRYMNGHSNLHTIGVINCGFDFGTASLMTPHLLSYVGLS